MSTLSLSTYLEALAGQEFDFIFSSSFHSYFGGSKVFTGVLRASDTSSREVDPTGDSQYLKHILVIKPFSSLSFNY